MTNGNLKKVREVVKNECNIDACTIGEISQKAGVSRNTARLYTERLIGEGYVKVRNVGSAKLVKYNPLNEKKKGGDIDDGSR